MKRDDFATSDQISLDIRVAYMPWSGKEEAAWVNSSLMLAGTRACEECVLSSTFSSIINAESWQTSSGTEKEGEVQTGLPLGVHMSFGQIWEID